MIVPWKGLHRPFPSFSSFFGYSEAIISRVTFSTSLLIARWTWGSRQETDTFVSPRSGTRTCLSSFYFYSIFLEIELPIFSSPVLPNHSQLGLDHAPIACPAGHHTMTAREHRNQCVPRNTSAISPRPLLRWWWWWRRLMLVLVWSWCVPGCAANTTSHMQYILQKSSKIPNKSYKWEGKEAFIRENLTLWKIIEMLNSMGRKM